MFISLNRQRINKKAMTRETLGFHLPVLQAAGSDTFTAVAILIVAIGLAGLAILILFSRKKI